MIVQQQFGGSPFSSISGMPTGWKRSVPPADDQLRRPTVNVGSATKNPQESLGLREEAALLPHVPVT
ncbi:MAG: hypothetical protein ACJ74Y_15975 [Bryobacteraceae bacterium]